MSESLSMEDIVNTTIDASECLSDCTDNNGEIYNTQPSDDTDRAIYLEIKAKLGFKDKTSFIDSLQDIYNNNIKEINHVRESLYDFAKQTCVNFPPGLLLRRKNTQGSTSSTIYKCAQDVYYLFHYIEGTQPENLLQSKVLSKASVRNMSMSTTSTPSTP